MQNYVTPRVRVRRTDFYLVALPLPKPVDATNVENAPTHRTDGVRIISDCDPSPAGRALCEFALLAVSHNPVDQRKVKAISFLATYHEFLQRIQTKMRSFQGYSILIQGCGAIDRADEVAGKAVGASPAPLD